MSTKNEKFPSFFSPKKTPFSLCFMSKIHKTKNRLPKFRIITAVITLICGSYRRFSAETPHI